MLHLFAVKGTPTLPYSHSAFGPLKGWIDLQDDGNVETWLPWHDGASQQHPPTARDLQTHVGFAQALGWLLWRHVTFA